MCSGRFLSLGVCLACASFFCASVFPGFMSLVRPDYMPDASLHANFFDVRWMFQVDVKTVDVKCFWQRCQLLCLQTCVDVTSVEGSVNKRETSFNQ